MRCHCPAGLGHVQIGGSHDPHTSKINELVIDHVGDQEDLTSAQLDVD